jgi:hypothetical protein
MTLKDKGFGAKAQKTSEKQVIQETTEDTTSCSNIRLLKNRVPYWIER